MLSKEFQEMKERRATSDGAPVVQFRVARSSFPTALRLTGPPDWSGSDTMPESPALMTPPSTIAHYRITARLGEGGMGEVWRATDTKLNRDVAIKIPEAFAQDAGRMARFQREAMVLASLNHPTSRPFTASRRTR